MTDVATPKDDWVTTSEAADIAGVVAETVRTWRRGHKVRFKPVPHGRRTWYLVHREDVLAMGSESDSPRYAAGGNPKAQSQTPASGVAELRDRVDKLSRQTTRLVSELAQMRQLARTGQTAASIQAAALRKVIAGSKSPDAESLSTALLEMLSVVELQADAFAEFLGPDSLDG